MKHKLKQLERSFVYTQDEYFASCHASTLVKLGDGRILTACFGGSGEGHDDVCIWVKTAGDDKAVRICFDEELPHWNPVLYRDPRGKITLYFKVGKTIPAWVTMYCESTDDGGSWGEIRELVEGDLSGGRGPVKNKPVLLSDGSLFAPRSFETPERWTVQPDISVDGGKSWSLTGQIEVEGLIQPSAWEKPAGCIHMLMRSKMGRLYRADSDDFGRSWSGAYPTALPNNNSGIDLAMNESGLIALALNPVEGNWAPRTPLKLYLSEDGGDSFHDALTLESEPGEYSYPAIIPDGGFFHCVYTWNRKNIIYTKIGVEMGGE